MLAASCIKRLLRLEFKPFQYSSQKNSSRRLTILKSWATTCALWIFSIMISFRRIKLPAGTSSFRKCGIHSSRKFQLKFDKDITFWYRFKPAVLSLGVANVALLLQWKKDEYNQFMIDSETKIQILKDRISCLQAQLAGDKVLPIQEIPIGKLFLVLNVFLPLPASVVQARGLLFNRFPFEIFYGWNTHLFFTGLVPETVKPSLETAKSSAGEGTEPAPMPKARTYFL